MGTSVNARARMGPMLVLIIEEGVFFGRLSDSAHEFKVTAIAEF